MPVRTLSTHVQQKRQIRMVALVIRNHGAPLAQRLADPGVEAMDAKASKAKTREILQRVLARRRVRETIGR